MKRKTILRTSLLATALLGAGVFASSVKDIENITGKDLFLGSAKNEERAVPMETQGIYKTWVPYNFTGRSGLSSYTEPDIYANYYLQVDDFGNKSYYVGLVFPDKETGTLESYPVFLNSFLNDFMKAPKSIVLTMQDLDRKPESGWTGDQITNQDGPYDIGVPIRIEDNNPTANLVDVTNEEEWPFDLGNRELYADSSFYQDSGWVPSHHILYQIPLTSDHYDEFFSAEGGGGLYEYNDSADVYSANSMHTESSFVVKNLLLYIDPADQTGNYSSIAVDLMKNSEDENDVAARLNDRDQSLWLKYPEPTLNVTNATQNSDGTYEILDGSFATGYNFEVEYNHSVTDEKYSILHSIDFSLYGPSLKGDTNTDVLWDHWYLDDEQLTRQFRVDPFDPNAMSDEYVLATNGSATGTPYEDWFDGVNEKGIDNTAEADDLHASDPEFDEKDGEGDINIGLVDSAVFNPGDPTLATGENANNVYTTGFLFSDSPYRAEITLDGHETVLGEFGASFSWPTKIDKTVFLQTDVYEPETPVITKFEYIDDPLHNEAGEIKNSWSYSMDAKTDNEFDGTSYYPSLVEYVQLVGTDGTVYSEMIPTTSYEETGDGIFEGTFESGNLPANQTDLGLKLKVYYGKDVGHTEEDTPNGKFWTTLSDQTVTVNTGVRGSADFTSSMNLVSNDERSATVTLSVTPVITEGTDDSIVHWSEDLTSYETADIKSGTISVVSEAPASITNDDLNNWDQGTAGDWENVTSWDLTSDQLIELNTTGSTTVVLNGILPNEDYTVKADMVYEGETKPSYADERWDSSWETDRLLSSNEVSIHTNDTAPYAPDNITLSYDFVDVDTATRTGKYVYEISMDVSGYDNNSDIYSPSDVTKITFESGNHALFDITPENAATYAQEDWIYDEASETLTVSYESTGSLNEISDTVSATIEYAGGVISTYDANGGAGGALEASISVPDRGNLDVELTSPVETASTTSSITFSGTVTEIIPHTAAAGGDTHPEQYAANENFEINIVTEKEGIIATTTVLTPVSTKAAGDVVNTYNYEVTAEGLNPNKEYDVKAVATYNGTSKINNEGYLAGEYPDVNEVKTVESTYDSTDGTTDALEVQTPVLTLGDVEVLLDEESRDITAKGQFTLDVVSEAEEASFSTDYKASEVTAIRIMNGDQEVYTMTDAAFIDSANKSEIVVDYVINSEYIKAKTDYDLTIKVDYAGGTKEYSNPAQHIKFNSGSRGDLSYDGITSKFIEAKAGPMVKMSYGIDYSGDNGYAYEDFNLLNIEKIEVNSHYITNNVIYGGNTIETIPDGVWTKTAEPLLTIEPYTYDGEEHEFTLGYEELINGLPRFPGAPDTDELDPEDDTANNDGIYDQAYMYKFEIDVYAEFPDDGNDETDDYHKTSNVLYFDQFDFDKGGFTPAVRDFALQDIIIEDGEEGPEASVKGNFWIEHRSEGFYDGMLGDEYAKYNEMDMWETGLQSISLINVTDPDRDDYTVSDPLDQKIWDIADGGSTPDYFDEPNSYKDTPSMVEGDEIPSNNIKYEEWLNGEHTLNEFTIDGLRPGENYKFKLIVHYSGDDLAGTHSVGEDAVVDPKGYDHITDFEIDVPLAGVEQIQEEDLGYSVAKSSLTSFSLGYNVANIEVDPRYEDYVFKNISIIDRENNEVIAESSEKAGTLVAQNLTPGTDPVNSGWEIVVTTEDGQELAVAMDETWLASAVDMDGNSLATIDGEDKDWAGSESDAIESWDIKVPEDGFVNVAGEAQNISQTGFELTLNISEELATLMNYEYVDINTMKIFDVATGVQLETSLTQEAVRNIEDFAGEKTVYVSGLEADTEYGIEGFDIVFDVTDVYSPAGEAAAPVSFATTDPMTIRTLPEPEPEDDPSAIIAVVVTFSILIPVILIVLFILWFIMLAWRKEKETEFKPSEVTFRLNRNFDKDSEKLNGAKLQSANGALTHSIKKDIESGKILVTVSNLTSKDPIKGLKFIVDNSTVKASNAKVEASNKELETKYAADVKAFEATLKAWEDNKAKATEAGKEFTEAKPTAPAKPSLAKLAKPNKDIKIVGSVKVEAPAPKEPKPAKEEKPTEAKKPAAPRTDVAKQPAVKKPTESKEQNSNDEDDKKSATGSAEIIY